MLTAGAFVLPTIAHAQGGSGPISDKSALASNSSGSISEIIVTARKREERLIEVPISIQVLTSETLQATGAYDLQDLKALSGFTFIKALSIGAGGRAFGNLTFRGLQGEGGQVFEASGALFVDGIYVSGGQSSVNTVDVDRVEILKGPQNAFFGRSTFGGAINLVTKNPSKVFRASVNASATSRGSSDVDATIEGPLVSDRLTARLTLVNHDKAAEYRATDGGALGAEKTQSITGTAYATPTEGVWLRLRGHYQKDDDSAAAFGYLPGQNSTSCAGKTFGDALDFAGNPVTYAAVRPYFCGSIPSLATTGAGVIDANTDLPAALYGPLVRNSLNEPYLSKAPKLDHAGLARNVVRLSGQMGLDLPHSANLVVNIGYNKSNQVAFWDLDRSAQKYYYNLNAILTHDFTADARITTDPSRAIRGLLGISYFSSSYQFSKIDYNVVFTTILPSAVGPSINQGNYTNERAKVPAIYGSIDLDFARKFTLSLDGRYQVDQTTDYTQTGQAYVNKTKKFLPRVSLSFKPGADSNIYLTYSEGVQPLSLNTGYINAGILNPPNAAVRAAARAYISSTVSGATEFSPVPTLENFEFGVKQRLLGGALEYSFAAFYEKWKNRITVAPIFNPASCTTAQASTVACPLPSIGTSVTYGNDVNIKGIELSVAAKPIENLSVTLYGEYKDAVFPRYYSPGLRTSLTANVVSGGAPAVTFLNRQIGKSPKLTGSVSATYRRELTADYEGYVRTDVSYVGKQWESDYNFAETSDFVRVNVRFGVAKGDLSLEVFAKNLFNDKNWDNAYRLADLINTPTTFAGHGVGVTPPDKREIGVAVRASF